MALRFNIDRITVDTPDWTCKVQIVDMSHARESPEKKIRFLNLILKDEEIISSIVVTSNLLYIEI
ncbi:hypothetical protein RND71_017359 [Anisodus tanguticus]|uniref:Uncharacterized protein n=1 Tax=Anisodus tanguticus TaxID=243964 RepID=A0AAE1S3M0_9SOLA|nr:hypothetical protein RND71_017359 [Anisodus tanguticus]